jgi:uncharacterized protein (TIGR03435 family)
MRLMLLLAIAAAAFAQTAPTFEVATIRPTAGPIPGIPPFLGHQETTPTTLNARHTALLEIIKRSYGVIDQEIAGGPAWIRDERFDIVGKAAAPVTDAELWAMVRPLLEERFHLKYHREQREVSGLALVIGKNGPKLKKSEGGSSNIAMNGAGVLSGHNVPVLRLAQLLSSLLRRPVTDATGLNDGYDFSFEPKRYATEGAPIDIQSLLITATQEELGLRLESRKFPIQVMVIDQIQHPDEN